MRLHTCLALTLGALACGACSSMQSAPERLPIIDMHLHAVWWQPGAVEPLSGLKAPDTEGALRDATIAALRRYNVVKAVTSGPRVAEYKQAAPDRILAGLAVGSILEGPLLPDIASVKQAIADRKLEAIAEFAPQYDGIGPGDPRLAPYFAAAEDLDIPLGIHMGLGPPGAPYVGFPKYRMALSNPLQLEDVLVRHPKLRLYVMHAGWPMLDEMVGLLYAHPQVYVDIAVIDWVLPRTEFHAYLRRLVEAGYGDRIMFGSDQMMWPDALGKAIEAVESAPFLTAQQKRAIFHDNAARFLRLETASP